MSNKNNKPYQIEYDAFQKFIKGKSFTLKEIFILSIKSFLSLFEGIIRNVPGAMGFKLRYYYYRLVCKKIGKNVLIDVGVILSGPKNISIDDYTWIDCYCILNAMLGEIKIGKRNHIAPYVFIGSRDPVTIEDYVAIGASSKIYSNSQVVIANKRMSGPMIPEEDKAFHSAPVYLRKDSFLGANVVVLPGVEIGEGAVVAANSLVIRSVSPWTVVMGSPAKRFMKREKIKDTY